ncbi:hypothetical protein Aduo_015569 [Ancylostoma duodenale]
MFVLCADPCGSVCILAYRLLVRMMADGELDDDTVREIENVTETIKLLWHDAAIKLFNLKLHVLVDHAIPEDMGNTGTPYQWTSARFELLHRRLQLRLPQNTTNCEELAVENTRMVCNGKVYSSSHTHAGMLRTLGSVSSQRSIRDSRDCSSVILLSG